MARGVGDLRLKKKKKNESCPPWKTSDDVGAPRRETIRVTCVTARARVNGLFSDARYRAVTQNGLVSSYRRGRLLFAQGTRRAGARYALYFPFPSVVFVPERRGRALVNAFPY